LKDFKNKPLVIGLDPGISGAVAILDIDTMKCVDIHDLPIYTTPTKSRRSGTLSFIDVHKLSMIIDSYAKYVSIAVIEKVHAMPKQGVSSTFKFGYTAGQAHGILAANYLTVVPVAPNVWKPALGLSGPKQNSIDMARKLFDKSNRFFRFKKHHDRAEAALMAYYATKYLKPIINANRDF